MAWQVAARVDARRPPAGDTPGPTMPPRHDARQTGRGRTGAPSPTSDTMPCLGGGPSDRGQHAMPMSRCVCAALT